MTERDWLDPQNPLLLLDRLQRPEHEARLRGVSSAAQIERALRRFVFATLRALRPHFVDADDLRAFAMLGDFVEGRIAAEELREVIDELRRRYDGRPQAEPRPSLWRYGVEGALLAPFDETSLRERFAWASRVSDRVVATLVDASFRGVSTASFLTRSDVRDAERRRQAACLVELLGSPFRRPCAPAWRTETTLRIARGIHEAGDFSLLPVLGDALEEAGCDDEATLDHCRRVDSHLRGCWLVETLLEADPSA